MASLVEFQDFNLPHHSVIMPTIPEMQTLEEIMAQDVVQPPLPTPPLSPDHMCPSPSSEGSHDLDSGDSMDITEALLNEMMQYEQLFVDMEDDNNSLFGSGQSSFFLKGNFLMQDCMWNSHTYKPRNTINLGGSSGLYTPAPSPPPQNQAAEQSDQTEVEEEMPTANNDLSSESSSSSDQTDCISPNDVFPTYMLMPKSDETVKKSKSQPTRHTRQERTRRAIEREQRSGRGERSSIMTRRASASTSGNSRIQPQASTSSESGK